MRTYIPLLAASAVSGAILPNVGQVLSEVAEDIKEEVGSWKGGPLLPTSEFPSFETMSLDEIKAGLDLFDNLTQSDPASSKAAASDASEPEAHTFATQSTAAASDAASCAANPNMRFEWRQYSESDRLAFVNAIKCLMNKPPSGQFPPATSRYEDFVRLHQQDMPNVHQNAKFLLWHRYFVWTFEQVLRAECGFDRAFPWWDETLDAGKFAQSDMFTNPAYFGSLPKPDANGNGVCITDGAFAGLTCNIGPGSSNTPHCLSRAVDESATAQCNSDFLNTCNQRTSYADFESCLEYGPHGYGHNGIGSVMADVSGSPSDPVFWMHHLFIDHAFRIWQNGDSVRIQSINGKDHNGVDLNLDTVIYMSNIRPDVTVRDIIDTLGGANIGGVPFCYRYTY